MKADSSLGTSYSILQDELTKKILSHYGLRQAVKSFGVPVSSLLKARNEGTLQGFEPKLTAHHAVVCPPPHVAAEAQLQSGNLCTTDLFFMEQTIPVVSSSFWYSDISLANNCEYSAGYSQLKTFSQFQVQLSGKNQNEFGNKSADQVKIHSCKSTAWHMDTELGQQSSASSWRHQLLHPGRLCS